MLRMLTAIFLICFVLASGTQNAFAASADEAKFFVDSVGKKVLDVMNDNGVSKPQRQQALRELFSQNVDLSWMAQFVLGRGWQQATDDQKSRYLDAYKLYLLAHYTTNFSQYTGSNYTITGAKEEAEGQYIVTMQIKVNSNGEHQDANAGYRVRPGADGQFKITDIIVEGVSLITTERSEFAAVLQQKGMDGLIQTLNAKAKQEDPKQ